MNEPNSTTNEDASEVSDKPASPRLPVYAQPADPESASYGEDDGDFESAVAITKAYIGDALAILAKFHCDLMSDDGYPIERDIIATYSRGSIALHKAAEYVEYMLRCRDEEFTKLWDENERLRAASTGAA